jgi:bla regulator protein BlaR1
MTAIWMVYALVTGVVVAALAWLLEQLARSFGRPTRGVWIGAMGAMLLVGIATVNPSIFTPRPSEAPVAASAPAPAASVATHGPAGAPTARAGALEVLRERWLGGAAVLAMRMARLGARLTPWNRVLFGGWALLSAFLAGVVAHAAAEGRRLRHGLDGHDVDGTAVLLTEAIGPVAIGVRAKAILLPRWALSLDPPLLNLVVRHEREHLDAGDPAVLLVGLIAVVLLPWDLPLWWAWRRLCLATEVDCDSRVLRTHPDVRRYGQLLLLAGQRAARTPWASAPVFAVVAPLRPQASHLAHRIHVMTLRGRVRPASRVTLLVLGSALAAATVLALPAPSEAGIIGGLPLNSDLRAIVHLTRLGLANTPVAPDGGLQGEILLYGDGPVRVATGLDALAPLTDTLHLKRLPAITADVTYGDLHIVLTGPGTFSVGGQVTGGLASGSDYGATGRHVVLLRGGIGIKGGM